VIPKNIVLFDLVCVSMDIVHVNRIEMGEIDALDGRPDVCCFVRRDPSAIKIAGKLSLF
jgi:hypothetical protein